LLYLQIIAPDEWHFQLQGTGSERVYTSRPQNKAGKTLHAGIIDTKVYETFLERFDKFFEEAVKRRGDKRSAARNEQGHQKTPV
jgi:hypothetical protein